MKSPRRALYKLMFVLALEGLALFILTLTAVSILYVIGQIGLILFGGLLLVIVLAFWVVNGMFSTYQKFSYFYDRHNRRNKAP